MKRYKVTFTLDYSLGAYDFVTLGDRLEREIRSYLGDETVSVLLSEDD